MHTEKSKIMFSDYCRLDEINYCRLKLKAQLFSAFCKLAKEGERYVFTYWYSVVPLSKEAKSVQLSINAIIKDRQADTEDIARKIIPNVGQKTLFSTLSSILKFGKNHSKSKKIIGENKMVTKCPKCGTIVPVATSAETTLLKEEIKNKDLIIENLRKDNEELMATIAVLQKQKPVEAFEEVVEEPVVAEEVKEEEKVEVAAENIVAVEQVAVEEVPAEAKIVEAVEVVGDSPVIDELVEETKEEIVVETPEVPAEEEKVEEGATEEVATPENTVEEKVAEEEVVVVGENAELPVEEEKVESDTTPSEGLPEQVDEVLEETVQPEQEAIIEEPKVEEEAPVAPEATEEIKEEEKPEDPYQIYTIPTLKI